MRLTRWPLFNFLTAILVIRGGLFLYDLVRKDLAGELEDYLAASVTVRALPAVLLLAVGVLFFLVDILFIPADRLKR